MPTFTYEITQDGSPTVRIHGPIAGGDEKAPTSEAMHSLKGAFSETLYIYGTAIESCLQNRFRPRVLSMGLGLGYVEILAAASFLKFSVIDSAGGESFEIVPELRDWFRTWVFGGVDDVPVEFLAIYDEILKRTSEHFGLPSETVRAGLKRMLENGRWTIHGALSNASKFNSSFGCICFDAFSSKTSPDLWNEEFLKNFLLNAADRGCVLSTYACTGALKRALKSSGFELNIREGFASKRDSTFAVRQADGGAL